MRERRSRTARDIRRRAYGQNFLASPALAARLVRDAGVRPTDIVVDLGAGSGSLTAALATRARAVVAVELDPMLAAALRRRFAGTTNVTVVEGDARRTPLPRQPFRVVASLPFNLTTVLLRRLLDPRLSLVRADVVLQWEVARKRAHPSRTALDASWAPWWDMRLGRRIAADQFRPRPAVAAGVLVAERRAKPLLPEAAYPAYARFVKALFEGTLAREAETSQLARLFATYAAGTTPPAVPRRGS